MAQGNSRKWPRPLKHINPDFQYIQMYSKCNCDEWASHFIEGGKTQALWCPWVQVMAGVLRRMRITSPLFNSIHNDARRDCFLLHWWWSRTAAQAVLNCTSWYKQQKLLKLQLGCRIEVVHSPGRLTIVQGSDDLSRGTWIDPERLLRSSLDESMLTLEAGPFSTSFAKWLLSIVGYYPWTLYHQHHTGVLNWKWSTIFQQLSIWSPSPELGRQSLGHFSNCCLGGMSPWNRCNSRYSLYHTARLRQSLQAHLRYRNLLSSWAAAGLPFPFANPFLCYTHSLFCLYPTSSQIGTNSKLTMCVGCSSKPFASWAPALHHCHIFGNLAYLFKDGLVQARLCSVAYYPGCIYVGKLQ